MTETARIRTRKALEAIATYKPGKGRAGKVTKLSSNENPFAPLDAVTEAVAEAATALNRYPDMVSTMLRETLAQTLGLSAEQFVLGNGSCSVIQSLLLAVAESGDEVVMPWRSFEAYPILVGVSGATAVPVPLRPDFSHDVEALADAVTDRTRAVLLCTPNNPTGTPLRRDDLTYLMERVPGDVVVLLDEAYFDFDDPTERLDGTELIETYPNLIAARTFSKAYGLAGLRVGYAMAQVSTIEEVWKTTVPFSTNALAQVAALAALGEAEAVGEQVRTIVAERERVCETLRRAGWQIPDTRANFLWIPGEAGRDAVVAACEDAAISVRAFPDGVRISIGAPEENSQLLAALEGVTPR